MTAGLSRRSIACFTNPIKRVVFACDAPDRAPVATEPNGRRSPTSSVVTHAPITHQGGLP